MPTHKYKSLSTRHLKIATLVASGLIVAACSTGYPADGGGIVQIKPKKNENTPKNAVIKEGNEELYMLENKTLAHESPSSASTSTSKPESLTMTGISTSPNTKAVTKAEPVTDEKLKAETSLPSCELAKNTAARPQHCFYYLY